MYYEGTLSTVEALFVSRAQQKIAELGASLSEQASRGDVDQEDYQISVELQYAIQGLQSTVSPWTEEERLLVVDFYTLRARLTVYAYRELSFLPTYVGGSEGDWATRGELAIVDNAAITRDQQQDVANQDERDRIEEESIARDEALADLIERAAVENEIVSAEQHGGVNEGETFVVGTPLEIIIDKILSGTPTVSNFTFDEHVDYVVVGDSVSITRFSWDHTGDPQGLLLFDSEGIMGNVTPVDIGEYIPPAPIVYTLNTFKTITWTLAGNNIDSATKEIKGLYNSYYGKKAQGDDTPIVVTESDVLAGTSQLTETDVSVTFTADTTNGELGWIAVPTTQSGSDYLKWGTDTSNTDWISSISFIEKQGTITVNGVTYTIYRWRYRSPLNRDIQLSK